MADIKISELPVAFSVSDADSVVINQGGVTKTAPRSLVKNNGTVTGVTAGTGLSGGTITDSGTISVNFGTASGTVAQGNDSRIVNAVTTSRSVVAGVGLAGGGDLTEDRTLSVSFGTTAGTAAQGNDSRLSDSRTPTAHASTHAAGGSDPITPASIGAATTTQLADYVPTSRSISTSDGLTGGGDLSSNRTLSLSDVGTAGTYGSSSIVPVVTTNSKGQVSSVTTQQIAILGSQVSGNISGNSSNVTGTVAVENGGTGATTASDARSNLSAAKSGANTDITSVTLTTGTISGIPGSVNDIVNKSYADSIGSGINFHDACEYATIAPLSPSANYNQPGGATVGVGATLTGTTNAPLDVDGTTVSVGQRILVKNQSSQIQNGVYVVTQQGDGSTAPYILTRATDYDTSGSAPNEVQAGDFILVLNGSIANTAWVQQTPAPVVFGSSNIVFIQFAAASAAYLAGTGLSLSNNTFSITTTGVAALTAGSSSVVPVITTNTEGQITNLSTAQITPSSIGAVATADLTQLAVAGKVPQLDSSGILSTTQIPALTAAQIAQITPSGIGAVATADLTLLATAGKVPKLDGSGFLSTTQLATISGLPSGPVGSGTVVPVITTDSKGRIINLTTTDITGGGGSGVSSFSAGTTGFTPSTATTGIVTLAGTLNVANGGTGATTAADAKSALGGIQSATVRHISSITPASIGTLTGAVWNTGSPTVTFTSSSVTLLPGMSLNGSGLTANVIRTVDSATQITMSANSTGSGSSNLTVYNSTRTTMVTASAPTVDGRTLVANDIVLLGNQNVPATNGPWIVSSNSGTQLTLARPSWFQDTMGQSMLIAVQQGNTFSGTIGLICPIAGVSAPVSIGIDGISVATTATRTNNAIVGSNTFTGSQTFAANTASGSVPFAFQAGVLNTTPVAHRVEWDGSQMYVNNTAAERLPVATAKAQINAQTGTTYTIAITDAGYLLTLNNASAIALNIPTDASVAFPIGTQILAMQLGAGQVTVAAVTPGTTSVNGKNGLKTSGQYAIISLIKVAANSWVVAGDSSI